MKKNKAMRAASVMLIATLLTTSIVSGTYAKYVTTGTGSDTARVAEWGVTVTADGAAFGDVYKNAAGGNTIDTSYTFGTDTVDGEGDKVVAPGTKGTVAAASVTGTPEVDVEVTAAATVTIDDGWEVDGTEYFPIIFTVGTETYGLTGSGADNESATVAALNTALSAAASSTTRYPANTDLSTAAGDIPSVSWEWPFYVSAANDVKDTALGDAAADGSPANVTIDYTITVTQVD